MNGRPIDYYINELMGKRFGTLIVSEYVGPINKRHFFKCVCDCGGSTTIRSDIFIGKHKPMSCGCKSIELRIAHKIKHGLSKSPEYRNWFCMIHRCTNKNDTSFERYGAAGITVCERWVNSFENFLADMGTRPTRLHSIDRIDNSKGYSPDNCRWASKKEQAMNREKTTKVVIHGILDSLCGHGKRYGLSLQAIKRRIEVGMTDDEITSKKRRSRNFYKKFKEAA